MTDTESIIIEGARARWLLASRPGAGPLIDKIDHAAEQVRACFGIAILAATQCDVPRMALALTRLQQHLKTLNEEMLKLEVCLPREEGS